MTILIEREHGFSHEHITQVSELIAQQLVDEYGVLWQWQDNRLMIKHSSANGYLESMDGKLTIKLSLGFTASFFSNAIESEICQQLDKLLVA
ncbi:polyhydroxyalkanoic acid system family protein [Photobacterium damselae]|uniref:polyhydroxyalkanoic acid system family protein n=1 Tax=Photobacterium damselae TaxID=38293 RepID=UPI001EFCF19B|nr:polyhydroxyalkanoic acid system family protein [Photobacterium damselae]